MQKPKVHDSCQKCKSNPHLSVGIARGIVCKEKNHHIGVDIVRPLPTSLGRTNLQNWSNCSLCDVLTLKRFCINCSIFTSQHMESHIRYRAITVLSPIVEIGWKNLPNIISNLYLINTTLRLIYIAERPICEVKLCLRTYCYRSTEIGHAVFQTLTPCWMKSKMSSLG